MISIYKESNKNYDMGGDMVLDPISCSFNAKLNGNWELVLEHSYDNEGRWKYIVEKAVIRFPTPTRKDDLFRIYEVIKNDDTITAYAQPLFYDLKKKVILDKYIVDKDGQGAIDRILEDTDFTGHSNIKDTTNIRLVRKSVYDALVGDEDNTFASRLGGELYTNKKDIWIDNIIGRDNNVEATFGYNLKYVEEKVNDDNLYTRLYAEIFNGHTFDPVDSDKIDLYSDVYEGFVKFDDIKLEEDASEEEKENGEYYTEEQAKAEVIKRCKAIFEGGADLPTKTYTLQIANMQGLDEYKEYNMVTELDLGDYITVKDKILSSTVKARVIEFTWDCLRSEYTELVIGTEESNLFQSVSDATSYLNEILTSDKKVSGASIQGIINALNVQFRAQYNIAENIHTRAILFEDLDPNSETFGALCIGTRGLEISNKRNAQNTEWEWGTFITAGVVYADWLIGKLSTVLIQNTDGSFQMDLSKSNGMEFFVGNKKSMQINKNELVFYDNEGNRLIGGLMSLQRTEDASHKVITNYHKNNSFYNIDYYNDEDKLYHNYIRFDAYDIESNYGYPISFHENTDFFCNVCHYNPLEMRKPVNFTKYADGTQVGTIFQSTENDLVIGNDTNNSLKLCFKKDDGLYYKAIEIHRDDNLQGGCYIDNWGENVFKNSTQTKGYAKYYNGDTETGRIFGSTGNDFIISANYFNKMKFCYEKDGSYWNAIDIYRNDGANNGCSVDVYGDMTCKKNLTVNGTKNRAVKTENYGTRLLNAVESADAIFTDIGETTIGENGEVRVDIDPIFLETIETKTQKYQVFLTLYGDGKAYVSERNIDHFIIKGTAGLDIGFEIKAKQKDYTNIRLEEFKQDNDNNTGFETVIDVKNYEKGENNID